MVRIGIVGDLLDRMLITNRVLIGVVGDDIRGRILSDLFCDETRHTLFVKVTWVEDVLDFHFVDRRGAFRGHYVVLDLHAFLAVFFAFVIVATSSLLLVGSVIVFGD